MCNCNFLLHEYPHLQRARAILCPSQHTDPVDEAVTKRHESNEGNEVSGNVSHQRYGHNDSLNGSVESIYFRPVEIKTKLLDHRHNRRVHSCTITKDNHMWHYVTVKR